MGRVQAVIARERARRVRERQGERSGEWRQICAKGLSCEHTASSVRLPTVVQFVVLTNSERRVAQNPKQLVSRLRVRSVGWWREKSQSKCQVASSTALRCRVCAVVRSPSRASLLCEAFFPVTAPTSVVQRPSLLRLCRLVGRD